MEQGRVLTTSQVAATLRVSLRTVYRMLDDGRLEAAGRLPGDRGAFLFRQSDVEAIVAAERAAIDAAVAETAGFQLEPAR